MSDTPETDAVMKQHTEHSQNWLVIEMTNMSRKLERERDAAIAERDFILGENKRLKSELSKWSEPKTLLEFLSINRSK